MEFILSFLVGAIVFWIATNRVTSPTDDIKEEITALKKRIEKLEKKAS